MNERLKNSRSRSFSFVLSLGSSRFTVFNCRYYLFNQNYFAEGNLDYEKRFSEGN